MIPPIFDMTGCFVHTTADRKAVVRHSDGEAIGFLQADGRVMSADDFKEALRYGGKVQNPEGFDGHPEHDRDHPHHQLRSHGLDEEFYYLHWDAQVPHVCRKDTGDAVYKITEGRLIPVGPPAALDAEVPAR